MRTYFAGLMGLLFAVQACAFSLNDLNQNQAGDGLKAMLEQSTRLAVTQIKSTWWF